MGLRAQMTMDAAWLLVFSISIFASPCSPAQCGPRDEALVQETRRVRLMKDEVASASEGRVEVFYAGEFWRKVEAEDGVAESEAGAEENSERNQNWIKDAIEEGEWGTVCSWAFDDLDAKAVCRGLGFADGSHVMGQLVDGVPVPPFGEGSGRIWLEGVDCKGHESNLFECITDEWKDSSEYGWGKVHYDNHHHDVGVRCS